MKFKNTVKTGYYGGQRLRLAFDRRLNVLNFET